MKPCYAAGRPKGSELARGPEERREDDRNRAHHQSDDPAGDVLTDEHSPEEDPDGHDAACGDRAHGAALDPRAAALPSGDHALRPLLAARLTLAKPGLAVIELPGGVGWLIAHGGRAIVG